MAKAYQRQGSQIQYDSYRKNLALTPEDATSQHINYTVCSGFTYQIYKNALDINFYDYTQELLDFAKKNYKTSKKYVIHYSAKSSKNDETVIKKGQAAAYLKYVNDKVGKLKPGDLIVYEDETNFGHVVMFMGFSAKGDGSMIVIQAGGYNYNFTEQIDGFEEKGAITQTYLHDRLNKVLSENLIKRFAVIRIVTEENQCIKKVDDKYNFETDSCEISDSAESRLKYKGIDIEKTVDKIVDKNGKVSSSSIYASTGDRITYSIKIKNNSDKSYDNLVVAETIDKSLVELEKDNELSRKVNIKAGEEKVIKYTVKVKPGTNGKIIKSIGKVANIPSSTIEVLVGKKISSSDANKVCTSFINNINSNTIKSVERQYINDIYSDKKVGIGINLGLNNKVTNLNIIGNDSKQTKPPVRYTKILNQTVGKYIYNNFYGLKIGSGVENIISNDSQWSNLPTLESNDRARTITRDMLFDGDVILMDNGESYIYCSGVLMRKDRNGSLKEKKDEVLNKFLRNMVGDNYIILRPYK